MGINRMSTYVDKAINPKTKKVQSAIFIDDFYGHYRYGVAFRKDGSNTKFNDIRVKILLEEYEVYPIEIVKIPKNEAKIHTNEV
jgi:hypothetical protein